MYLYYILLVSCRVCILFAYSMCTLAHYYCTCTRMLAYNLAKGALYILNRIGMRLGSHRGQVSKVVQ